MIIMIQTMKLPRFTLTCLALMAAVPVLAQDKPNIIFMISDDHRWDALGAADNPNMHTPNMDRLASEGVYFREATIHNPQCVPSRAALLTGLGSHANGRYSNQSARLDTVSPHGFDQYNCLPEVMAANGYHTALVGKWHIPADPWNVGFEEMGTWYPPGAGAYKDLKLAHGKSREQTPHEGFTQVAFGDSAVDIIKRHNSSDTTESLFLWVAMTAPHSPFQPNPEAATAPYAGKKLEDVLPPTYEGETTGSDASKWLDYVAAITSVDIELGRILKTLDETGMASNTVVAFMGDNGFMMGNRGMQGKAVPFEDSIRVPMMVWGPGVIKAKGKTTAVASSLDLPPTFVKLSGAEPPKEWHGRDLTPVLADGEPHDITWSITEAPDYQNWKFPGVAYRAVRTQDSKLIVWQKSTGKAPEFYDIAKDPEEKNNLYADAAMKPRVEKLEGILKNWMESKGDSWEMKGPLKATDIGGKAYKRAMEKQDKDQGQTQETTSAKQGEGKKGGKGKRAKARQNAE